MHVHDEARHAARRRRDDLPVESDPAPANAAARLPRHTPITPAPLSHLLAADGPQARHRIVADLLREAGHDWLTYGVLDTSSDRLRPVSLWTDHAPVEWVRRYVAQAYFEVDPRLEDASASSLPCGWTLESLNQRVREASPYSAVRRLVDDLGATGIRRGVLFMLPGEGARRRHFMCLQANTAGPQTVEGAVLGRVLTLGLCLNEYYTRYSTLPALHVPSGASLTALQREILGHVARGESDKRIARLLRMSSHAVDYHMRKLRQRFEAQNRVQLAQASQDVLD